MSSSLPTGTVTFLFTDIEGSAPLAQQFPAEVSRLFSQHNTVLRQSIEAHNGHVFQIRGDAFCAAFFTASDALQAALQAQRQLQQGDWSPTVLKVRMGIHTGAAQASSDEEAGDGYTGYLTLTRVQRIMSLAYGCQILISNASAELLQGELPEGVALRDLGEYRLKGVLNPERIWQVWSHDVLSEFPPLPSLNAIPNNLPVQLSSFIGREHEITEVVRLLHGTRLLTLTGVGGAESLREKTGSSMALLEHAEYEAALDSIHAKIDESSFAEAWTEGREMTMEEAIAAALEPLINHSASS